MMGAIRLPSLAFLAISQLAICLHGQARGCWGVMGWEGAVTILSARRRTRTRKHCYRVGPIKQEVERDSKKSCSRAL